MVSFTATIQKFNKQGEKTGWNYIDISKEIACQLKPDNKKAFRVKGYLDDFSIEGVSLLPIGGGNFIMPLNATLRKAIHKSKGAMLQVKLEVDEKPLAISPELLQCLADEPEALRYFNSLAKSHQHYYSKWIDSAKTAETKAKRIAQCVTACANKQGYGEMIRAGKQNRDVLR